MRPFQPIVRNPHLLTIAGNFWPRRFRRRFPAREVFYQTDPQTRILVHEQHPVTPARAELILVHGLEGSSQGGYMVSMAQAALEAGFNVHRTNIRGCGGTEAMCRTLYHAGLTGDLLFLLEELRRQGRGPVFLIGFSLGGNMVLKLAGELGEGGPRLIKGVAAASTPIDLAACAEALEQPENRIYQRRFLSRMRERLRVRHRLMPDVFSIEQLSRVRTIYEFDDRITAPFFGMGTAARYYATQSSNQFLDRIRVPCLLVAAQDDPMVPFSCFGHPAIGSNPHIRLLAVPYGGHIGFIAAQRPRFWLDEVLLHWVEEELREPHIGRNKSSL